MNRKDYKKNKRKKEYKKRMTANCIRNKRDTSMSKKKTKEREKRKSKELDSKKKKDKDKLMNKRE